MPTYISMLQYTQQGIQKVKDSPSRLDAARKVFEKEGAKIKDVYLVMGEYDLIFVAEAPNDEVVAKLTLMLASQGNVKSLTARAFTESEYRKLIQSLP